MRNRYVHLQQSRVSNSSSNSSQNYELIPRQQAFFNPLRDISSPKLSFPFRKVQAGQQSASNLKNFNQSISSNNTSQKHTEIVQKFGEATQQRFLQSDKSSQNKRQYANSNNTEAYKIKIEQLERKIGELQKIIEQERSDSDLDRKANQIYTQNFTRMRQLIMRKSKSFEAESIEQLVQKLGQLLEQRGTTDYQIIEQQDKKIRQLRAELLKSTQNNINAIFNTEITEAYCLQHQIHKMNSEIISLKQKLIKATSDHQENTVRLLQNRTNAPQINKIIKIYERMLDSDSDFEEVDKSLKKRNKSTKNKLKQSRQSSSSQKSHRNKRLRSTQNKMVQLIDGYKSLRQEYGRLQKALTQINGSQTDFRELFSNLRKDITVSIQTQIKEVKQSVKRPSSSHEQLKIARQLQCKLNDLINALNAPEKANIQRFVQEEEVENSHSIQYVRRVAQLQSTNMKLQQELRTVNEQKNYLQEKILHISKFYMNKSKDNRGNELFAESVQQRKIVQIQNLSIGSRSDIKEQHINEHLSVGEASVHIIHTSTFNKLHSSQSYHQSSNKNTQVQTLYAKIQKYEQTLREKQLRINELENTILDHIQSRSYPEPPNEKVIRQRYEIYINNLKMLLNQSRKEYDILKKQLIRASQLSLSRINNDHDHNSVTLSDRTTKNCISQTRLRRAPKTNSFESIKAKLEVEDALERVVMSLLQFSEKVIMYEQLSRSTMIDNAISCLRQLIFEAKQRDCKLYEDIITNEDILKRLAGIGINLN